MAGEGRVRESTLGVRLLGWQCALVRLGEDKEEIL